MMKRDVCLKIIDEHRNGAIIVAHYQAAFDLIRMAPNALNYYAIGVMGQASSHGLGLALGLPQLKVIVLDGDGSLLMNLGTLVTAVASGARNLIHCVCENGCYETNGSHPLPGLGKTKLADMARAAGYDHVFEIDNLDDLRRQLPTILTLDGPVFCSLRIEAGERSPEQWPYINGSKARQEFARGLENIGAKPVTSSAKQG